MAESDPNEASAARPVVQPVGRRGGEYTGGVPQVLEELNALHAAKQPGARRYAPVAGSEPCNTSQVRTTQAGRRVRDVTLSASSA